MSDMGKETVLFLDCGGFRRFALLFSAELPKKESGGDRRNPKKGKAGEGLHFSGSVSMTMRKPVNGVAMP
jgi:hypothetical protein